MSSNSSYPGGLCPPRLTRTPVSVVVWGWGGGQRAKLEAKNKKPLTVIIPVVFYHGKKRWDISERFIDNLDIDGNIKEVLKRFFPDFGYILFDAGYKDFDYKKVSGLSNEIVEKLETIRPQTLFNASEISGVTPAAIEIIHVYIKMSQRGKMQ